MATKTDKKNAIRQEIMDSAVIYSSDLAGKTFLYVYGNDFFELVKKYVDQKRGVFPYLNIGRRKF